MTTWSDSLEVKVTIDIGRMRIHDKIPLKHLNSEEAFLEILRSVTILTLRSHHNPKAIPDFCEFLDNAKSFLENYNQQKLK